MYSTIEPILIEMAKQGCVIILDSHIYLHSRGDLFHRANNNKYHLLALCHNFVPAIAS